MSAHAVLRLAILLFAGAISLPQAALALEAARDTDKTDAWRDQGGTPIPETQSMQSKNGFAGSLLATTDEDWEKKWNTPPETKPNFNRAGAVPYGKKVFILTFFSNPLNDADGNVSVKCDIKVAGPDGKVTLEQQDMVCFTGRIAGSPHNIFLSGPVVAFSGDPGDPPGTWVVSVNLRDENRQVALALRTTFELK
jgi:hypothetical protein